MPLPTQIFSIGQIPKIDFQYWSDPEDQPTEQGGAVDQAGPLGSKQLPCG
jgi:hypothetical protein